MRVIAVETRRQMREFVRVPQAIFGAHPCYVPPIWLDEAQAYTKKANPILRNSDFVLFLALDEAGKTIGRTIAYIDHTFNAFYHAKIGFFGAFECIDDANAAALLVSAAEQWLAARGMETIRGPIHPVAENWGFVLEGTTHRRSICPLGIRHIITRFSPHPAMKKPRICWYMRRTWQRDMCCRSGMKHLPNGFLRGIRASRSGG